MRCGVALPLKQNAPAPEPKPAQPVHPAQQEPASVQVAVPSQTPEWRKEVTRKAREFGERKRLLTTPPGPIKETPPEETLPPPPKREPPPVRMVTEPPEPKRVERPRQTVKHEPVPANTVSPVLDVSPEDLQGLDEDFEESEPQEPSARAPIFLMRRLLALLADNTILLLVHLLLIYFCAVIINYDFRGLLRTAWPQLAGVFLFFHCVYYLYFWKSARQTPGQVFFGLELRDPNSGIISLGKIFTRWAAMVFLNVFNLLPLFWGKPPLPDTLSHTEIRSLK
jgi:uncharacterized RDD family membrane protein YckC